MGNKNHAGKKKAQRKWQKRQHRQSAPAAMEDAEFSDGIVVVHGIGNQKPGQTLHEFVAPLRETLDDSGLPSEFEHLTSPAGQESTLTWGNLKVQGLKPVLIAEARWVDLVSQHRLAGLNGVLARFLFLISTFPYLLTAALAPRFTQTGGSGPAAQSERAPGTKPPSTARKLWKIFSPFSSDDLREIADMLPVVWRMMTVFGCIALIALAFRLHWWIGLSVVLLLAVLLLIVLGVGWRSTFIEHVRMAAASSEQRRRIVSTIEASVAEVSTRCSRIWMIGHSQGGYLVHQLLSSKGTAPSSVQRVKQFTGVASGLQPITLAAGVSSLKRIIGGWILLLGAGVWFWGIVVGLEPGGFLHLQDASHILSLAEMTVLPMWMYMVPDAMINAMRSALAIPDLGWDGLLTVVIALIVSGAGLVLALAGTDQQQQIHSLGPQVNRWDEWSSPSDLVGSMSVLPLPDQAMRRYAPTVRQPIVDHGIASYFRRNAVVRFWIAAEYLKAAGSAASKAQPHQKMADAVSQEKKRLTDLSSQLYLLRGGLLALVLFWVLLVPWMFGASLSSLLLTAAVLGILASLVGWVIAMVRWWRFSPVGSRKLPVKGEPKKLLLVTYLLLVVIGILGGFGLMSASSSGAFPLALEHAIRKMSDNVLSSALFLSLSILTVRCRLWGSRFWTVLAFIACVAAVTEVRGLLASGYSFMVIPGVLVIAMLTIGIVVQLWRSPFVKADSSPGEH